MAKKSNNNNFCAALSYLVVGLIWYFLDERMRKDQFAKYHAKQAIVVILFAIAGSVAAMVPIIGMIVWVVTQVLVIIWVVLGIVYSLSGKKAKMFIVGDLAKSVQI